MPPRKTPLSSSTPLSRTSPLPRTTPLPRTGRKPVGSRSKPLSSARPKVSSEEERRARKLLRARSADLCEMCGRRPATDAHHRRNRSQGGLWEITNLLHLCHQDHMAVTVNPALACSRGWSVRSTDIPADVPVWLAGKGWSVLGVNGDVTSEAIGA